MRAAAHPSPKPPTADEYACPRCGYDLTGVRVATPVSALVCPECGFQTTWRALTDPDRPSQAWHLELAERRVLAAGVRTSLVCLFPAWLWARITLELPVRRGRLLAFAFVHLALAHLLIAAVAAMEAPQRARYHPFAGPVPLIAAGVLPRPPTQPPATTEQVEDLDRRYLRSYQERSFGGLQASGSRGPLAVLEEWLAEQRIAMAEGEAERWALSVNAASPQVSAAMETARLRTLGGERLRAWLMPYAPRHPVIDSRVAPPWTQAAALARFGIAAMLLMPVSLLALRPSFRLARVRSIHLLRGFAYASPGVLVLAAGGLLPAAALAYASQGGLPEPFGLLAPPAVALILPLSTLWFLWMWAQHLSRYLRLPDAKRVLLASIGLSLCGSATFTYFLWDGGGVEAILGIR